MHAVTLCVLLATHMYVCQAESGELWERGSGSDDDYFDPPTNCSNDCKSVNAYWYNATERIDPEHDNCLRAGMSQPLSDDECFGYIAQADLPVTADTKTAVQWLQRIYPRCLASGWETGDPVLLKPTYYTTNPTPGRGQDWAWELEPLNSVYFCACTPCDKDAFPSVGIASGIYPGNTPMPSPRCGKVCAP